MLTVAIRVTRRSAPKSAPTNILEEPMNAWEKGKRPSEFDPQSCGTLRCSGQLASASPKRWFRRSKMASLCRIQEMPKMVSCLLCLSKA